MPTKTQLTELQLDLENLVTEFESLLVLTESRAQPVQLKDNAGRLSRMDEMHNQSILLANRNLTKRRLKQAKVAISKIAAGVYGDCTVCDEPIAYNRLKAYPETAQCLACQSQSE